ncbi:hypothetical protein [Ktedonospora formicarum]|uniref:Uncharacterized protein n=1 Tax=Ktedonospora formicarum TaxID=2778364 RepID=A0A8J3I469_9CHLR|nr:hypothetical protein [Ktedonospora formicarum]GHO49892.1 hypothetical protein KSX_80550 [Ktedonospora formicarum]
MNEDKKLPFAQPLEDAKKSFLEDDLNDLEFEIEELETRLAFTVPTDGGGCEGCCDMCTSQH